MIDCAKARVDDLPFLAKADPLCGQSTDELLRIAMEQGLDLFQRDADESEGNDLLQNFEIVFVIRAIPRRAALGREQADPVVVDSQFAGIAGVSVRTLHRRR